LRCAFFALCLLLTSVLIGCGGSTNAINSQGTSLSVNPATASLTVGDALQLQAVAYSFASNQSITPQGSWSSSDAGIVKVNSNGLLLGITPGYATVTFVCSSCQYQSVDVPVTVNPKASSLNISPISANINSGSSFQFTAAGVIDGNQQDVTNLAVWSLDNSLGGSASIVGGLLTIDTGAVMMQTIIQVTVSYGGLKASAPVFVNP